MDHHFLIRYSFTGIVLLIFAFGGLWTVDGTTAANLLSSFSGANIQSGTAILSVVATVPVIGVMVHGAILLYVYGVRGHSFSDTARGVVAEQTRNFVTGQTFQPEKLQPNDLQLYFQSNTRTTKWYSFLFKDLIQEVRDEAKALSNLRSNPANPAPKRLKPMPDDSIFVWLYYFDAPEHLIEWARRRRDYYYLGVGWALAAFFGLLLGMAVGVIRAYADGAHLVYGGRGKALGVAVLVFFWLGWILCAFWLGIQMKHDVDSMELAWASALIEPKIENNFKPGLPGDLQDGLDKLQTSVNTNLGAIGADLKTGLADAGASVHDGLKELAGALEKRISQPAANRADVESPASASDCLKRL